MSVRNILMAAAGNAAPPGQVAFTTPGTYSWTVPAGVFSVSFVCIGGGGGGLNNGEYKRGGGGGGLRYIAACPVSPGEICTVYVGAGGIGANYAPTAGGLSYFDCASGQFIAYGGAAGAAGSINAPGGAGSYTGGDGNYNWGGGAAGYFGNGGKGVAYGSELPGPTAAYGGGSRVYISEYQIADVGGGGVGIYGAGDTGSQPGAGGSGGAQAIDINGALYGGGASCPYTLGNGGGGAVRIIWGAGRAFPSTLTGDM